MFQCVANNHCCDCKKSSAVSIFMAQIVYEKVRNHIGQENDYPYELFIDILCEIDAVSS